MKNYILFTFKYVGTEHIVHGARGNRKIRKKSIQGTKKHTISHRIVRKMYSGYVASRGSL